MAAKPFHDLALWQVHQTEGCDLIIRSNYGYVFYCHIDPCDFIRSPSIRKQCFKCVEILRSGEVELDNFYEDDAFEWLQNCFEPLIAKLAPSSEIEVIRNPTLVHYFFPEHSFVCNLEAVDDELQPKELDTKDNGWIGPIVRFDSDFLAGLNQWTLSYTPSEVQLVYDGPEKSLIRPPTRCTIVGQDGQLITCFFKKFQQSFGQPHATKELFTLKKIASHMPLPPEAFVCRLIGVVREGNGLLGMLFAWINKKCVLSQAKAKASPPELRKRWASQIRRSLDRLHENDIIWGDAKAANVLIDQNDDAWIIDFGGSYTVGWVDKDKAGTLEGDRQGLAKILDILQ